MNSPNTLEWNESVGLFRRKGPGHTRPVAEAAEIHSLPESFIAFAIDAQLGRLNAPRFEQALQTLTQLQVRDPGSPLLGCLRWYYEEPHPIDTNASFFTGLTLIFIERTCALSISPRSRSLLADLFAGLKQWFQSELREGLVHYPNKYLGDLVCAWLLAEMDDSPADLLALEPLFCAALTDWRENHWGWGEHLSHVYSTVMLTEISLLLFLQRRLPEHMVRWLVSAANDLLQVQDFFGDQAWTPTIRCYDFEGIPHAPTYRSQVRQWDPQADAAFLSALPSHRFMRVCFGHFLHHAGWHERFPKPQPPGDNSVPLRK